MKIIIIGGGAAGMAAAASGVYPTGIRPRRDPADDLHADGNLGRCKRPCQAAEEKAAHS